MALLLVAAVPAGARTTFGHPLDTSPGNSAATHTELNINQITPGIDYAVPSAGVLTAWGMRTGAATGTARLKLFSPGAGASWRVDAASDLRSTTASAVNDFPVRLAAAPGQRIGIHTNGPLGFYLGALPADRLVEWNTDTAVGTTSAPDAGPFGSNLANVQATIEPDADGDAFGDESQDLCPGDAAHGGTACSGTLLGSNLPLLQNAGAAGGGIYTNLAVGSGQVTAPVDGVVVRWRRLGASGPATSRLRVLHLVSGTTYMPLGTSAPIVTPSADQILRRADTRLPIAAGDTIGLERVAGSAMSASGTAPGSSYTVMPAVADGTTTTAGGGPIANSEILFDADVEPDADGDGFGDVTQDACPTAAVSQSVCPEAPVVPVLGSGGNPGGGGGVRAAFDVALARGTVRVPRRTAAVSLGCPAGSFTACAGQLRLDRGKRLLGQAGFTIPAGKTARVNVRLSRSAIALLKRAKKISAVATVAGGTVRTESARITLRPKARRKSRG